MKTILIVGKNSYIGLSFTAWLRKFSNYDIQSISLRDNTWKDFDFSKFEVVLHIVGIAHVNSKKYKNKDYYIINRNLAIEVANKAKRNGVKQFVFLSSMMVYSDTYIKMDTKEKPTGFYGDSKYQADRYLTSIASENFRVVCIRPPMVYGKNCKGNYSKLAKAVRLLPVFPDFENKRSMIHIDNLCEFIRYMIDKEESGIFYPQNQELVCTTNLAKLIAQSYGKTLYTTKLFNPIISILKNKIGILNKLFGDFYYDVGMSRYKDISYCVNDFEKSIQLTEK